MNFKNFLVCSVAALAVSLVSAQASWAQSYSCGGGGSYGGTRTVSGSYYTSAPSYSSSCGSTQGYSNVVTNYQPSVVYGSANGTVNSYAPSYAPAYQPAYNHYAPAMNNYPAASYSQSYAPSYQSSYPQSNFGGGCANGQCNR